MINEIEEIVKYRIINENSGSEFKPYFLISYLLFLIPYFLFLNEFKIKNNLYQFST
jgi:hypothetical protein